MKKVTSFGKLKRRGMKRATMLKAGVSRNAVKRIVRKTTSKAPAAQYTGFMIARHAKNKHMHTNKHKNPSKRGLRREIERRERRGNDGEDDGSKQTESQQQQQQQQPALDKGWARAVDPRSGLAYVYNLKTRETVWESVYNKQQNKQ